jgi:hypothetical protein
VDVCLQPEDGHRLVAHLSRPVSELATLVLSPCDDRAVATQREAVAGASRDRHDVVELLGCDRLLGLGARAVAELTAVVVAPRHRGTATGQGEPMGTA